MSTTKDDVRADELVQASQEQRRAETEAVEKLVRSIAAAAQRQSDGAKLHDIGGQLGQLLGFRETGVPDPEEGFMIRVVTLAAEALDATGTRG